MTPKYASRMPGEVGDAVLGHAPQALGHERRRERDAVGGVAVRDLGDRGPRGVDAVGVAAVHRVGPRRERLPLAPAVRGVAGGLAVDDVRRDGEDRLGVHRVAVGRVLAELAHEGADDPGREVVDPVVVVAEHRELALGHVVRDEPRRVADDLDLGVLDRRQAVGDDGQAGHAEGHGPERRVVVQRHLDPLVGVLVVHVVDDVHGVHVDAREPVHHLLEAARRRRRSRASRPPPPRASAPPGRRSPRRAPR